MFHIAALQNCYSQVYRESQLQCMSESANPRNDSRHRQQYPTTTTAAAAAWSAFTSDRPHAASRDDHRGYLLLVLLHKLTGERCWWLGGCATNNEV